MRYLSSTIIALILSSTAVGAQTATDNVVTATWALASGTGNETASVVPEADGASFLASTGMTLGSEITARAESGDNPVAVTYEGYTQTFFRQGSKTSSATDNNAITFLRHLQYLRTKSRRRL